MVSYLFRGQTSFKAIRPQTSFPYLDERRFRGLGDVQTCSKVRPHSRLSDLRPHFLILMKGGSEVWVMSRPAPRRFRGLSDVQTCSKVRPHSRLSDLRPHFLILMKGGSETSFKAIRPQTSFPYLDERRFRGLSDVQTCSKVGPHSRLSDLRPHFLILMKGGSEV
ncbi:hypothetical protein ACS0TY_023983 [Phlomoides rotata]